MAGDRRSSGPRSFGRTASTLAPWLLLCVFGIALSTPTHAAGGVTFTPTPFSDGPPEFPNTGVGWNLDARAEAKKAFGEPRYSMKVCTKTTKQVKIEPQFLHEKTGLAYNGGLTPAVREILRRAIIFSWKNCPRDSSPDPYMIQSASIYAPNGEELYRADDLKRTGGPQGPLDRFAGQKIYVSYAWQNFTDLRQEAYIARMAKENAEWWENFRLSLKVIFWLAVSAGIFGFLLRNWETVLRFYYELTPHPAASMVKDAIRAGVEFDTQAFADIVRDSPDSRVGRDVRNAQAAKLAAMARMSNEQLRRVADELRHQFEEQAKYRAAHGEGLDEVAERLAKARADAYAKAEEFWKSRRKT